MAGKMASMTPYDPCDDETPAFVSVADLADFWQVGRVTVNRMVEKGEIEGAIRIGRSLRIPTRSVIEYMERNAVIPTGDGGEVESGEEDELPPEDD